MEKNWSLQGNTRERRETISEGKQQHGAKFRDITGKTKPGCTQGPQAGGKARRETAQMLRTFNSYGLFSNNIQLSDGCKLVTRSNIQRVE